jgi:hypothetical protein
MNHHDGHSLQLYNKKPKNIFNWITSTKIGRHDEICRTLPTSLHCTNCMKRAKSCIPPFSAEPKLCLVNDGLRHAIVLVDQYKYPKHACCVSNTSSSSPIHLSAHYTYTALPRSDIFNMSDQSHVVSTGRGGISSTLPHTFSPTNTS